MSTFRPFATQEAVAVAVAVVAAWRCFPFVASLVAMEVSKFPRVRCVLNDLAAEVEVVSTLIYNAVRGGESRTMSLEDVTVQFPSNRVALGSI